MRFAGLSICLLVSTLSARAEALETHVAMLEERIKTLEEALQNQDSTGEPLTGRGANNAKTFAPSTR